MERTIEDAMTVVHRLGFRYLWVDCYCLPQSNPAAKHSQIQRMGDIYAQSALIIIAIAGESPDYGLSGVSSTHRKPSHSVEAGNLNLVSIPESVQLEYWKSKWISRGWTYQDGLLAQRRLLFTDSKVYFQCAEMYCKESLSLSLQKPQLKDLSRFQDMCDGLSPRFGIGKRSDKILVCIEEYAKREFTYPSDALDAFRGFFRAFQSLPHPVHHICGVIILDPMMLKLTKHLTSGDMFVFGLCWGFLGNQPLSYRPHFPSWTWLGWQPGSDCSFTRRFSLFNTSLCPKNRFTGHVSLPGLKWDQKLTWRLKIRSGGLQRHEDFPKFSSFRHGSSSSIPI